MDDFINFIDEVSSTQNTNDKILNINESLDFDGMLWSPIDLNGITINGNGNVLSNFTIGNVNTRANLKSNEMESIGLFSVIDNSVVKDLSIEKVRIDGIGYENTGILAGEIINSKVENIVMKDIEINGSKNTGIVSGKFINSSLIGVSIDNANIEGENVGVVGTLDGTIENVVVKNSDYYGSEEIGGITAIAFEGSKIENVKVLGKTNIVSKNSNVGGIVGIHYGGDIKYALVDVEGNFYNHRNIGGIVGLILGKVKLSNVTVTGVGTIEGNTVGGIVGRSDYYLEVTNAYVGKKINGTRRSGNLFGYIKSNEYTGIDFENISKYDALNIKNIIMLSEPSNIISDTIYGNIHVDNLYYRAYGELTLVDSFRGHENLTDILFLSLTDLKNENLYENWDRDIWNIDGINIPSIKY